MEAAEPKAPADKGKGPSKSGKRFEIKKWNAVAMWSWAICTDTCAICRNNLYEPSIEYQANPTGAAQPASLGGLLANWAVATSLPGCNCMRMQPHTIAIAPTRHGATSACTVLRRRQRSPRPQHCVGKLRPRLPPRLHPAVAEDTLRLPAVQQGAVGVAHTCCTAAFAAWGDGVMQCMPLMMLGAHGVHIHAGVGVCEDREDTAIGRRNVLRFPAVHSLGCAC